MTAAALGVLRTRLVALGAAALGVLRTRLVALCAAALGALRTRLHPAAEGVVATCVTQADALALCVPRPQAVAEGIVATCVTQADAAVILAALPRPVMAALHVEETATAAMLLVKESIHRFINIILSRFLKILVLPKIGRS